MLGHISEDILRFGDLVLRDAAPFEHFNYSIQICVRTTFMSKCSSTEEAVKEMNASVKDETCRRRKILKHRPLRLAEDGFRTIIARTEHCLHEILAHLTLDGKASISKCVLKHFRGVSTSAKNTALPTNIILQFVKTDYICGRANIVLEDYDAVRKSFVIKRINFNVTQRVFADAALGPTKCRRLVFFLCKRGRLYWFAQTFFLFHVNLHGPGSEKEQFVFLQYSYVSSAVVEIDKELNCGCSESATDDGLSHSVNFDISNS